MYWKLTNDSANSMRFLWINIQHILRFETQFSLNYISLKRSKLEFFWRSLKMEKF